MQKKEPLIVIGCGGHAQSVIDIAESTGMWEIIGLIGQRNEVGKKIMNYEIIGTDDDLKDIRSKTKNILLGIGQIKDSRKRIEIIKKLKNLEFNTPTIISRNAYVSKNATIEEGCSVGHFSVINSGAKIGRFCILNSKCLIEHNSNIGDFCHISTGVIINGDVSIGNKTFLGSGCIIREGLSIPDNIVLGAGKRIMGWPLNPQK